MVKDEGLKTHTVEGERCQRHPRTLSSPVSCDEGSLRAWIPQTRIQRPQTRPGTNNINVLIFVLHISLSARLCIAHTGYYNWSLWTSHRTLLASLASNFFFGDSKRGRGNSSLNSWLIVRLGRANLRKEDDTVYGYTSQNDSKTVANKLLHGGFIISFMKFIIVLIFTMTNLSASNDAIIIFSRTHWGKKLKFSSFLNFNPWSVYKLSTSAIPLNTRLQQLEWYQGNFKVSPAWRRMPTDFCLYHHFFNYTSSNIAALNCFKNFLIFKY